MIMIRTLLTLAAGIGVGVAVTFAADHDHHKDVKVTQLFQRDIVEKLDGRDARVTVQEVAIEPGGPRAVQRQGTRGPDHGDRRDQHVEPDRDQLSRLARRLPTGEVQPPPGKAGPLMRTVIAIALGAASGAGGFALAQYDKHGDAAKVKSLLEQDVSEKIDGKEARVSAIEVSYGSATRSTSRPWRSTPSRGTRARRRIRGSSPSSYIRGTPRNW
jgi:hypothetical protein